MWSVIKKNPISAFAVLLVAAIGIYIGIINFKLTEVLSGPGFCGKAVGADKLTPGTQTVAVLNGCIDLLKLQVSALGTNSHIFAATMGLCVTVLIVVVVAGARASAKANTTGFEFDVGREADKAADHVVEGAKEAAAEVKEAKP